MAQAVGSSHTCPDEPKTHFTFIKLLPNERGMRFTSFWLQPNERGTHLTFIKLLLNERGMQLSSFLLQPNKRETRFTFIKLLRQRRETRFTLFLLFYQRLTLILRPKHKKGRLVRVGLGSIRNTARFASIAA